jgi:hypothetical protein
MSGDKGSDISSQLKRPAKVLSRSSRTTPTTAAISTPPKAALASGKSKKAELHRRKHPLNEMLLQKSGRDSSSSRPSTPEERVHQRPRNTSVGDHKELTAADRISELERALAAAREEQDILRAEVDRARKQGYEYKDNGADSLRVLGSRSPPPGSPAVESQREFEKEKEDPAPWMRERLALIEQNYELRGKATELQEKLVEQEVLFKARIERGLSQSESDWNELTRRLHHSEKEAQERLQQLLDLKHSISALTRMDSQVSDADLVERMGQLYHRTREWIISNLRRSKLDFSSVSGEMAKAFEAITPNYSNTDSTQKIPFYQAVVLSNMMYIFKEPVCIGLPETGPLATLLQLARYIHDSGSNYREWRRTTIRAIENSQAKAILAEGRDRLLHQLSLHIQNQLFSISGIELASSAKPSLFAILQYAADLQHMLLLQKAQYNVRFFRYTADQHMVVFDPATMVSINDEDDMDEDMYGDRKFEYCVFPMLEKFGDEVGENLQVSNVLLKARVCCGVG